MLKNKEKLLKLILGLFLVIFISILALNSFIDEDKILQKMDEALIEGDFDYLKDKVRMSDGESIEEKDLLELLKRMRENEKLPSKLPKGPNYNISPVEDGATVHPLSIVNDGRKKIFYNDYNIVVQYIDLIVSSNFMGQGFKVFLDGEELVDVPHSDFEFVIEKIKPGRHTVEIKYGQDLDRTFKREIDLYALYRVDLLSMADDIEILPELEYLATRIPRHMNAFVEIHAVEVFPFDAEGGNAPYDVALYVNDKYVHTFFAGEGTYMVEGIYGDEKVKLKAEVKVDDQIVETLEYVIDKNTPPTFPMFIEYDWSNEDYSFEEVDYDDSADWDTEAYIEPDVEDVKASMGKFLDRFAEALITGNLTDISFSMAEGSNVFEVEEYLYEIFNESNVTDIYLEYDVTEFSQTGPGEYKFIMDQNIYREVDGVWEDPIVRTVEYILVAINDFAVVSKVNILG